MYPMMITDGAIVIAVDGRPYTIGTDHANHSLLEAAIKAKNWDAVPGLVTVAKAVEHFADGASGVAIKDGVVTYKGYEVHSSVGEKLLDLMEQGFDIAPLARFLARVESNPSISARRELYDFCEANGFVIDVDGYIIAYKSVRHDYMDKYTGQMDNSVGALVSMPRETVNADRNLTCSAGLHFAAFDYAANIYGNTGRNGSDHLMVLRIDPADVVAIPTDYNNKKGRAWKYQIVDEITDGQPLSKSTYNADDFKVKAPATETPADDGDDLNVVDIRKALNDCNWVIGGDKGAAALVGLNPRSFRRRMVKFGIARS